MTAMEMVLTQAVPKGDAYTGLRSIVDPHSDDRSWEITKAYNYGVIMGKRNQQ